ncbi:MAG TPA: SGNH/GDSL hydrolase family protein [Isosphaeraceae bacterium]|jgi:hypothetical protein|nr:SGNH/GDSL hydrolase family protein [Isosphaeraceae bacterium]
MFRIVRRVASRADRQRWLPPFVRRRRLETIFRAAMVAATVLTVALLIVGTPFGQYATTRLYRHGRMAAERALGLEPDRDRVDADWRAFRARGVDQTRARFRTAYANASPGFRELLKVAGMTPDDAVIRWANYDWTLVLPSKVFEVDDSGRSYRLRPNTRSFLLEHLALTEDVKGFFYIPDTPEVRAAMAGTPATIASGSEMTVNSWGCRGPEPDPSATIRGIVLGDSFMQGFLIGDAQAPPAVLERTLSERFGERVSVLNAGVLGYSTEQYYYTLKPYAERFDPHFVVVAPFANDFGEGEDVLKGKADWEDARHWLDLILSYCRTRRIACVVAPVPPEMEVAGIRKEGQYPAMLTMVASLSGPDYCYPVEDFVDEHISRMNALAAQGRRPARSPLYNGHVNDHHFSPVGATIYARAVARRVAGLIEARRIRARAAGGTAAAP